MASIAVSPISGRANVPQYARVPLPQLPILIRGNLNYDAALSFSNWVLGWVLLKVLGWKMTRGEQYRQYAAECIRVAQQIQSPRDKTTLLDMAQKWRALAAKVEAEDGTQS